MIKNKVEIVGYFSGKKWLSKHKNGSAYLTPDGYPIVYVEIVTKKESGHDVRITVKLWREFGQPFLDKENYTIEKGDYFEIIGELDTHDGFCVSVHAGGGSLQPLGTEMVEVKK